MLHLTQIVRKDCEKLLKWYAVSRDVIMKLSDGIGNPPTVVLVSKISLRSWLGSSTLLSPRLALSLSAI
jgi:hypothetical protein